MTDYLFSNHTEVKRLMITENKKETMEYLNIVNDDMNTCEFLLDDNQFKYSLIEICAFEPLMQTKVETMISGFINQLRSEFLNYNQSYNHTSR